MTAATAATSVVAPTVDEARELVASILVAAGAPGRSGERVAESLVQAERMGHASHGLVRVLEYVELMGSGQIQSSESPVVCARSGSVGVIDGKWGFGHPAADLAARTAASIARETGVGFVTVRNCNHSGRLGEWVELIAAGRDLIGIGLLSCGPAVAPLGGLDRVLGTNPIAIAVPTGDRPVVLDFATAGIAEGKVRVAARAGKQVPEGVLQTADGEPTTDPDAFYAGGAILPFGLHKGYALSVVVQLLGEAMTGGGRPDLPRGTLANGVVLLALSADQGAGHGGDHGAAGGVFVDLVDSCRSRITSSRPADPDRPVLMPGDIEADYLAGQPAGRVRVNAPLWNELLRAREEGHRHE